MPQRPQFLMSFWGLTQEVPQQVKLPHVFPQWSLLLELVAELLLELLEEEWPPAPPLPLVLESPHPKRNRAVESVESVTVRRSGRCMRSLRQRRVSQL